MIIYQKSNNINPIDNDTIPNNQLKIETNFQNNKKFEAGKYEDDSLLVIKSYCHNLKSNEDYAHNNINPEDNEQTLNLDKNGDFELFSITPKLHVLKSNDQYDMSDIDQKAHCKQTNPFQIKNNNIEVNQDSQLLQPGGEILAPIKEKEKFLANRKRIQNYFLSFKNFVLSIYALIKTRIITFVWIIISAIALTSFFLTVYLLILRYQFNYPITDIVDFIESITENIKQPPWIDIIIPSANYCPPEFSLTNFGYWVGTISGCYYPKDARVVPGNCLYKDKSLINIPFRDSIILTKWKNTSFCIKTAEDYYFSLKCDSGYIQCSPGLCYNSNESCPITNIIFTNQNYSPDLITTKLEISSNKNKQFVYFEKKIGAQPVFNLKHSFYGVLCYNKAKKPLEKIYYNLMKNHATGCGDSGFDPQSSIIDSDIEKQFYLSNNLNWSNNQLPNYDIITIQRIALLVQQKKYELSNYVTDLSSLKIIQNSMDDILTDFVNYDYYLNIMSVVSASFHIFIFVILVFCRIISCCGYEKIIYMPINLMILAVIPDAICFSLLEILKISLSDFDKEILKLRSSNYFVDDIINQTFSQLFIIFDILNYQFFICYLIFIISSAVIILPFIYFLCYVIMSMRII